MVRLVAAYHEDLLVDTHLHLAKVRVHDCVVQTLYHTVKQWTSVVMEDHSVIHVCIELDPARGGGVTPLCHLPPPVTRGD